MADLQRHGERIQYIIGRGTGICAIFMYCLNNMAHIQYI